MDSVNTPNSLGYRWPAEWEPHAATWVAWPHNQETWPGRFSSIPRTFTEIIRTLARFEPVRVLAGGHAVMQQAEEMVGDLPHVQLVDIPTNDAWVRDYGPIFLQGPSSEVGDVDQGVAGRGVAAVDWQFNSWGGKYPPWDRDDAVTRAITAQFAMQRFAVDAVLEGGAIDGNGQATVLTTRSCLLDPRRNTGISRHAMERLLHRYCGATEVIWIAGGPIAGDDTDGHVDQLARFVASDKIVVAVERNKQDANYDSLQTNWQTLQTYRSRRAAAFDIIELPMPRPICFDGQRVPASYCNFYIANRCVLVPLFDDPADEHALAVLRSLFPGREIVGIFARELVWGLGALHCLTQQQPAPSGAQVPWQRHEA